VYPFGVGVLQTQRPVAELQAELVQTRLRLAEMERKLAPLIAAHREQIRRSLSSKDETERWLAESVFRWWEVTE
jgi:hypothetical protein